MAKTGKVRKSNSQCLRSNPYPLSSRIKRAVKEGHKKGKCSKAREMKDWKDAICSVCLEFPHNAVLLLCSSYAPICVQLRRLMRSWQCQSFYVHSVRGSCMEYRSGESMWEAQTFQTTSVWQFLLLAFMELALPRLAKF
ncbi:hypothetical protein SLEP1_g58271 [Rubroshorea leprosula]|uniref:Uncharacterized protein n=1 Tax=Rubroshorea leprosula TaxID=152421 RepID=A0AAV5MP70_9ROSI|nr:hypothetical protein SLEP1_g58271 [Rubroshorea leprosula]